MRTKGSITILSNVSAPGIMGAVALNDDGPDPGKAFFEAIGRFWLAIIFIVILIVIIKFLNRPPES